MSISTSAGLVHSTAAEASASTTKIVLDSPVGHVRIRLSRSCCNAKPSPTAAWNTVIPGGIGQAGFSVDFRHLYRAI